MLQLLIKWSQECWSGFHDSDFDVRKKGRIESLDVLCHKIIQLRREFTRGGSSSDNDK